MTLIESIIERAKSNKQRIVLPESLEERTLTAADMALADEIAEIILIGNREEIFALAEALIGAALITGVWKKPVALAAIALQGFFTLLTLALVIFTPEMDCGCFGEAIHLTHGETFIKNLILLTLLLLYYIPKKHLGETRKKKYISFALVMTSVIVFSVYSIIFCSCAFVTF